MKQIRVLDNQGREYTYSVDKPVAEVTIGRSESNDIILSSKTVSRRHAIVKIMGDRVLLVNQSANGVLVNGERVDRVSELDYGQFAHIKPYRFCVQEEGGGEQASSGAERQSTGNQSSVGGGRSNPGQSNHGGANGRQGRQASQSNGRDRRSSGGHAQARQPQQGQSQQQARRPQQGQSRQSRGNNGAQQQRGRSRQRSESSGSGAHQPVVRSQNRQQSSGQPAQSSPQLQKKSSNKNHGDGRQEVDDLSGFLGQIAPAKDYEEPRVNLLGEEVQTIDREKRQTMVEFKHDLHDELKERLDLHSLEITNYRTPKVVRKVSEKLKELLEIHAHEIPEGFTADQVFKEMMDQVCGLGPIEDLIKHKGVTEIMVVDRDHIYAELDGQIVLTDRFFNDEKAMMTVIERIVIPRGRRIDETTPLVDTRLADGSRVNAVIPPLALKDPCLTIRKFPEDRLTVDDLVDFGSLTPEMSKFLGRCVKARKNILIAGGTGSGKTTLLNVLSSFIQPEQRIVTIEDAAELQLHQDHVVSLETKPPNLEGKGEITIRDLVKNALRMRPDRIVVGECRGGEALDMLQAMNTGHEGSMTTVHCNSPREAISRLETLVMMSGMELPTQAIREQIANSIDIIVQQTRYSDGSRRVSHVTEVLELNDDGLIEIEDIYKFKHTGMDEDNKVQGYHMATGYLPSFLDEFLVQGLADEQDFF
jgi:pilus assembly protein CpaF